VMDTKYPEIEVQISGEDGNAFFIIGRVRRAMKRGGVSQEEIEAFTREATAGNYDHLLQTCMRWVDVA
jgi:hypothetical protein